MTEQEAREKAEALAFAMGITFYVVRSPEGDYQPVQSPPEDREEIIATVPPPTSVHDHGFAPEDDAGTAVTRPRLGFSGP
jgi:hypothetical protein